MADIAMTETPHLSQLFLSGQECTIVYPGKPEVKVWVQRPSPDQHEECMKRARASRARRYHELTSGDTDEHMALMQEIEKHTKQELVKAITDRHRRTVERQALQEVLFSEEYGSDWGKEGEKWTAVLDGIQARLAEIDVHNKELKAAKAESGLIDIQEDEEIARLSKVQEQFESEVNARRDELLAEAQEVEALKPIDRLQADLIEQRVSLECDLSWFATFKYEQLFRAVRYIEDTSQLYFQNAKQIEALPREVQDQLFEALNEVDINADALKNSSTPLPSSVS